MRKDFQLRSWNGQQNRAQQPLQISWQRWRDQARDNSSSQSSIHQYQCFLCPSARHSCCSQAPQRPAGADWLSWAALSAVVLKLYEELQCWKVSCEWRLQTLSQGQAIKICKWGPGERKWSGLLTLEQTTHITGGCMKIEVKETTVTFRAQKLSDNTFT